MTIHDVFERKLLDKGFSPANAPGLSADECLKAAEELRLKDGRSLSAVIQHVKKSGDPLLILNLCQDRPEFISALTESYTAYIAYGLRNAAKACGTNEIVIFTGDGSYGDSIAALLPGYDITVISGSHTPVLREGSALLPALCGKAPRSELLSVPIETCGYLGRPNLSLDIETAIWLAAACAAPNSPGGKLMLLEQDTEKSLLELPLDIAVSDIVKVFSLPEKYPVLLGGITGFFTSLKDEICVEYTFSFDSLRVYTEPTCMAQVGKDLCAESHELSCGKCVLCREGSYQMMSIFTDITQGKGKRGDSDLVMDIGSLIKAGAFCDYGKKMVDIPMSLMQLSGAVIDSHINRKVCPEGLCAAFTDYIIDPLKCNGCCECLDACPEDAIEGKSGFIHMIDPVLCTKCGKCTTACPEDAVISATGRVKLPKKLTKVGRFK